MKGLPENQIDDLKNQLSELRLQLESDTEMLEELSSQTTKNVLLAKMGGRNVEVSALSGYLLELQQLHNQMLPYWPGSSLKDKNSVQQDIDALWIYARKLDSQREGVLSKMDGIQSRQRTQLSVILGDQKSDLMKFSSEVVELADAAEDLGYQASLQAFANVTDHVDKRMFGAELGAVKVSWIRTTDIEKEIYRVRLEQGKRSSELNTRFSVLKSRLMEELSND